MTFIYEPDLYSLKMYQETKKRTIKVKAFESYLITNICTYRETDTGRGDRKHISCRFVGGKSDVPPDERLGFDVVKEPVENQSPIGIPQNNYCSVMLLSDQYAYAMDSLGGGLHSLIVFSS